MLGRADEIRLWGSYTNVPLTPGQKPTALPSPVVPPIASASALRRVLRRARDGVALNVDEAAIALTARGDDLADLCASAARVRDAGLESAGRRGVAGGLPITYSRKVFIPVTHLCRDSCHYCTFVTVPGKLRAQGMGMYMEPDEILDVARRGAELGCKEALFTLGDRPEDRWPEAREWLDERGYDSTLSYVRAMAIRVLEETGLLPHLNPGVMSWSEMSRLKPVAPSMGMMLETTSRRLFETKGLAHYGSPDKDPAVRLRTLTDAGRLSIPFTTGLLVGIGETLPERADTLHAIRKSHKEFGHVQEVIVQNFRAKEHTAMAAVPDAGIEDYLATVAVARLVLGPGMRIQAPPNLVSRDECLALIAAGVDDWGGVSPLTPDHVNPERPWPALDELAAVTAEAGYDLVQRLTAQPKYVQAGAAWIDPRVRGHVAGAGRSGDRPGPRRQPGRACPGRSPTMWSRPVGWTCTRRSTPRAATPRPAAIWTAPSATGNRSAHTCTSWPRTPPRASTPMCLPRCARRNVIPPAAPTTSTWRWRPPTVPRWKPLPHWRIRCAATRSATT